MNIGFEDRLRLDEKYKNFVKNIIANDKIWFLHNDGRVAVAETEAGDAVALWGSKEAAKKNQMNEWKDFSVESMAVAEFLMICVPEFSQNNVDAMVEMQDGEGIWKNLIDLESDFENEAEAQGFDLDERCDEIEEKLEVDEDYIYMLHKIVRDGCAWALFDDGRIAMGEFEGEDAIPLWASEEDAKAMASEEWAECEVGTISLDELLEELLPMLAEDDVKLSFLTEEYAGLTLDAETLAEDLREIMSEEADCGLEDEIDLSNVIPFPKLS